MMNGESHIAPPLCPSPKKCKLSKVVGKLILARSVHQGGRALAGLST
jgi:hypothetical protein